MVDREAMKVAVERAKVHLEYERNAQLAAEDIVSAYLEALSSLPAAQEAGEVIADLRDTLERIARATASNTNCWTAQEAFSWTHAVAASALDRTTPLPSAGEMCSDCPPVGYPTDKTRCLPCPRRAPSAGEAKAEPVGWTTERELLDVENGVVGRIWRDKHERHSVQLAAAPHPPADALRGAVEAERNKLLGLIRWAHDTLIEINPSNYTHDDVCEANAAAVEVILGLAPTLGETHGKTAEWWQSWHAGRARSAEKGGA